jgi:hypothetical protein
MKDCVAGSRITYACAKNNKPRPVTDLDIQVILREMEFRRGTVSTAIMWSQSRRLTSSRQVHLSEQARFDIEAHTLALTDQFFFGFTVSQDHIYGACSIFCISFLFLAHDGPHVIRHAHIIIRQQKAIITSIGRT